MRARNAPDPSAGRPARPALLPDITDRCTGCGRCVAVCPARVLWLEVVADWRKTAVLHDAGGCTGCARCAPACPYGVITMRRGT